MYGTVRIRLKQIKAKPFVAWHGFYVSSTWRRLHGAMRLTEVRTVYRALQRVLHFPPRLAWILFFPALGKGFMFSRAFGPVDLPFDNVFQATTVIRKQLEIK